MCRDTSAIGRVDTVVAQLLHCCPGVPTPKSCPLRSSKVLERIVTAARTNKRQGIRIAQHSAPPLGHTEVVWVSDPCPLTNRQTQS